MADNNRSNLLTEKVSTPFGSMYIHIYRDKYGNPCGGSISHQRKDMDSTVSQMIEKLSHALNAALGNEDFKRMKIETMCLHCGYMSVFTSNPTLVQCAKCGTIYKSPGIWEKSRTSPRATLIAADKPINGGISHFQEAE